MKKFDLITPEGTRDLLFDESVAIRTIEKRVRDIFTSSAYSEVITPGLEFYDVFNLKKRYFSQETMYKLTDNKGRLMVLRPDSTMPIARLVATRLRDEKLPLKLFYNQNIFRVNPKDNARDDEITQSGIEIIGGDEKRSDLEALTLAIEVLTVCDEENYRLEIGDSAFFKTLISRLNVAEETAEEIRVAIETKNYPELNVLLERFEQDDTVIALKALPKLFGGKDTFERAAAIFKDDETRKILASLRDVYNSLEELGVSDKISVDLGLVNRTDYYTGVLFKGYIEGCGMSVLSGGRYNTLIGDFGETLPATGFALNINAAANVLLEKTNKTLLKKPDVLVFAEDGAFVKGLTYCRTLISQEKIVDNSLFSELSDAEKYAKEKGISELHIIKTSGDVTKIKLGGNENG